MGGAVCRANYNGRSSDKCPCISVHCPSIYSAGLSEWPDGKRPSSASEAGPSTKCDKRQVTKATFEKWQQEHERDHQTLSWLRCELERDKRRV